MARRRDVHAEENRVERRLNLKCHSVVEFNVVDVTDHGVGAPEFTRGDVVHFDHHPDHQLRLGSIIIDGWKVDFVSWRRWE